MTNDEIIETLEKHVEEIEGEAERCKDAIRALQGRKKPGRPALKVA